VARFRDRLRLGGRSSPDTVVYTEDDAYGRAGLFAFSDPDAGGATQRFGSNPLTGDHSGDFTWPGTSTSNGLVAWWRFDASHGLIAPDASCPW